MTSVALAVGLVAALLAPGAGGPAGADDAAVVVVDAPPIIDTAPSAGPPTSSETERVLDDFAALADRPATASPPAFSGSDGVVAASVSDTIVIYQDPTPPEVRQVVEASLDAWSAALDLDPAAPLVVSFGWREMSAGLLGYAGPTRYVGGGGLPPGYHPVGLANRLLGRDVLPDEADVVVVVNSAESWHLDPASGPAAHQSDLASTLLHELAHGLGFVSSAQWRDGHFDTTDPVLFSYDRELVAGTTPLLALGASARRGALVSGDLSVGIGDGRRWPVHAPSSPVPGSSIGHFDEAAVPTGSPGSMMTPQQQRGTTERRIDAPVLGVLAQLGWPLDAPVNGAATATVDRRRIGAFDRLEVAWTVDDHRTAVPADSFVVEVRDGTRLVGSVEAPGFARGAQVDVPASGARLSVDVVARHGDERAAALRRTAEPAVATGTSATPSFDADARPLRDQVRRLYLAYFGREPDAGGLEHWMRRRVDGAAVAQVSAAFADSDEFARTYGELDDPAFVDLVYRNVMGRAADPGGRAFWVERLAQGVPRGEVMTAFAESNEFSSRTGTAPPEPSHHGQVRRLYEAYFERTPDASGMAFWVARIEEGRGLAEVSAVFAASDEFARTYGPLDDAAFVDLVYRNVLRRDPDAGGRAHWVRQLGVGLDRGSMMVAFSESPENIVRSGTLP